MTVSVVILDADTGKPLPGATVELYASNVMLKRAAAGADGNATLSITAGAPELIRVSNTEYIPAEIRVGSNPGYAYLIKLQRIVKDIQGVTVTSFLKKNSWAWLIILAGAMILANKKKSR